MPFCVTWFTHFFGEMDHNEELRSSTTILMLREGFWNGFTFHNEIACFWGGNQDVKSPILITVLFRTKVTLRIKWLSMFRKDLRKGLNSLIILVAWEIWKHHNSCVFDKKRPSVQEVLRAISSEGGLWCSAGASKLQELVFRLMPSGA